jgi:hypothetical protein
MRKFDNFVYIFYYLKSKSHFIINYIEKLNLEGNNTYCGIVMEYLEGEV